MTSYCRDDRLLDVNLIQELSDTTCCIITVFHWHVTVHEDQVVVANLHFVLFHVFNHHVESLLAIEGLDRKPLNVFDANGILENCFQSHYIVRLIVHDHYFPVEVYLIRHLAVAHRYPIKIRFNEI